MNEFRITQWCGIPHKFIREDDGSFSESRLAEMKEAGINIISTYDYGFETYKELFATCEHLGLKVILADKRIDEAIRNSERRRELISEVVNDYKDFPALHSYHIIDEPNASLFPALAEIRNILGELDGKHEAYINLFPNYASEIQLGNATYREHLSEFSEKVRPEILSFDHYHFLKSKISKENLPSDMRERQIILDSMKKKDRAGFFDNLEAVRDISLRDSIPFMVIVLVTEHGSYRYLSDGEIRFEVYQSLAYGACGISYFTYWTPGVDSDEGDSYWHWKEGMIAKSGERNEHYYMVQKINTRLSALGNILFGKRSLGVYHIGKEPDKDISYLSPTSSLSITGNKLTVGIFDGGMILLANKDYERDNRISVKFVSRAAIFDAESGKWINFACKGEEKEIKLASGECELIRIEE